jgi:hypothetical protein
MLGMLLGRPYARWCVRSMLRDAQRHFAARRPTNAASQAAS